MNDDLLRLRKGREMAAEMTKEQNLAVGAACERVRMGKSGYWHELAGLVMERDRLLAKQKEQEGDPDELSIRLLPDSVVEVDGVK